MSNHSQSIPYEKALMCIVFMLAIGIILGAVAMMTTLTEQLANMMGMHILLWLIIFGSAAGFACAAFAWMIIKFCLTIISFLWCIAFSPR